jgi:hypothetical protein
MVKCRNCNLRTNNIILLLEPLYSNGQLEALGLIGMNFFATSRRTNTA